MYVFYAVRVVDCQSRDECVAFGQRFVWCVPYLKFYYTDLYTLEELRLFGCKNCGGATFDSKGL